MLSLIVGYDQKTGGIGKDNQLPWHSSEDLKHFKRSTTGKSVIMGSTTFFSIGRVLPNRTCWVLTRDPELFKARCEALGIDISQRLEIVPFDGENVPDELVAKATHGNDRWWVIGGARIYKLFLPYCSVVVASEFKIPGSKVEDYDTFFDFGGNRSGWAPISSQVSKSFAPEDYTGPEFNITMYVPAAALEEALNDPNQQYWNA